MTSLAEAFPASPSRGAALRRLTLPVRSSHPAARRSARSGAGADVAAAALLALGWILLWTFFVVAVAGPAARLHGEPIAVASASRPPAAERAGPAAVTARQ